MERNISIIWSEEILLVELFDRWKVKKVIEPRKGRCLFEDAKINKHPTNRRDTMDFRGKSLEIQRQQSHRWILFFSSLKLSRPPGYSCLRLTRNSPPFLSTNTGHPVSHCSILIFVVDFLSVDRISLIQPGINLPIHVWSTFVRPLRQFDTSCFLWKIFATRTWVADETKISEIVTFSSDVRNVRWIGVVSFGFSNFKSVVESIVRWNKNFYCFDVQWLVLMFVNCYN